MTEPEANKIFKQWQEFIEINDKLSTIFTSIPESFLPYPANMLEEALNIVAKRYHDKGDHKASRSIQGTMVSLMKYKDDDEAIEDLSDNIILKNPELRKAYLSNLKKARDSWAKLK